MRSSKFTFYANVYQKSSFNWGKYSDYQRKALQWMSLLLLLLLLHAIIRQAIISARFNEATMVIYKETINSDHSRTSKGLRRSYRNSITEFASENLSRSSESFSKFTAISSSMEAEVWIFCSIVSPSTAWGSTHNFNICPNVVSFKLNSIFSSAGVHQTLVDISPFGEFVEPHWIAQLE